MCRIEELYNISRNKTNENIKCNILSFLKDQQLRKKDFNINLGEEESRDLYFKFQLKEINAKQIDINKGKFEFEKLKEAKEKN